MGPGTTAKVRPSKSMRGEARVTYLKPKYAVLSKPGLDGGIFLVPSSVMGQQKGYPDMQTLLALNDIVKFEAVAQEEKNGIKWQALDGSVELVKRAEDVEWRDTGVISFLDERSGQFGFIEASRGSVWFNANVVRPESRDVARSFKLGQTVSFVAVENHTPKNQSRYRATIVHHKNYKKPETKGRWAGPSIPAVPTTVTTATAATPRSCPMEQPMKALSSEENSRDASPRPPTPPTLSLPPRTQPLDIILCSATNTRSDFSFAAAVAKESSEDPLNFQDVVNSWSQSGVVDASLLDYFTPGPRAIDPSILEKLECGSGGSGSPVSWSEAVAAAAKEEEEEAAAAASASSTDEDDATSAAAKEEEEEAAAAASASSTDEDDATSEPRETYSSQLHYLQRIAHKLLGISSSTDCPVCHPPTCTA